MSPKEKAAVAAAAHLRPVSGRLIGIRIIRAPRGNASTLTAKSGNFLELGQISVELVPV